MTAAQMEEIRRHLTERFETRDKWQQHQEMILTHYEEYVEHLKQGQQYHLEVRAEMLTAIEVRHTLMRLNFGLPEDSYENFLVWMEYLEGTNTALAHVDKHIELSLLLREEIVKLHQVWDDLWAILDSHQNNDFESCEAELSEVFYRMDYYNNRREFLEDKFTDEKLVVAILLEQEPEWI